MFAYLRLRFWQWLTSQAQWRMVKAVQAYQRTALHQRRADAFVRAHEARRQKHQNEQTVGHSSSG